MISPIAWATRSPLVWLFPLNRCISRRPVRARFADFLFMLFVFLPPFKSRRPCTIQRYFACFSYSLFSSASLLCYFPAYPIYNWLHIIVCFLFSPHCNFFLYPVGLPTPRVGGIQRCTFFYGSDYLLFQRPSLASSNENGTFFHPLVLVARGGLRLQTGTIV